MYGSVWKSCLFYVDYSEISSCMNLEGVNTGCLYTKTATFSLLHILQPFQAYDHRFCLHMKTETIYTGVVHQDLEKKGGGCSQFFGLFCSFWYCSATALGFGSKVRGSPLDLPLCSDIYTVHVHVPVSSKSSCIYMYLREVSINYSDSTRNSFKLKIFSKHWLFAVFGHLPELVAMVILTYH